VLRLGQPAGFFTGESDNESVSESGTAATVRAFLSEVTRRSAQFSGELLCAALQCTLLAPPPLMSLRGLHPSLRAALRTGMQHPPLAAQVRQLPSQGTFGMIQGTFGMIQGTFGMIQGTTYILCPTY
jgi:hypothetical protein